jgi:hypothetical protein
MEKLDDFVSLIDAKLADIETNWQRNYGRPLVAEFQYVLLLELKIAFTTGQRTSIQHKVSDFIWDEFGCRGNYLSLQLTKEFRECEFTHFLRKFRQTLEA